MSGTNLKELRKHLGLSQLELAGPNMTRNLLSMIENGHIPLTPRTAEALSQRINLLFSDKPGFEGVTADDLVLPGRYQARMEIRNLLNTIAEFRFDNHFNMDHYLTRISSLFSEWDLPREKTLAYRIIASFFEDSGKNQEAQLYYSRAYENASRSEDPSELAETALCLSRTALKLEHYQSAIQSAEALRSYEGRIPDLLLLEVFLNQAVAYMAAWDYEHALGSLIFCEHLVPSDPPQWLNQLLTLKIQCYISKGMFGIANRMLLSLEKQLEQSTLENTDALRITLTCLRGKIEPASLSSQDLNAYWDVFSQAPSSYPHFEELFLRLMDSALLADAPELFEKISWRAVTDISPRTNPVSAKNVMALILKAWRQSPTLDLMPHWRYFLGNSDHFSSPGYTSLILRFIAFFEETERHNATTEALNHFSAFQKPERV